LVRLVLNLFLVLELDLFLVLELDLFLVLELVLNYFLLNWTIILFVSYFLFQVIHVYLNNLLIWEFLFFVLLLLVFIKFFFTFDLLNELPELVLNILFNCAGFLFLAEESSFLRFLHFDVVFLFVILPNGFLDGVVR